MGAQAAEPRRMKGRPPPTIHHQRLSALNFIWSPDQIDDALPLGPEETPPR
jgi:hypothetical protein